ncbi:hypothetical protein [Clostridium sporogenes]|uniref:hypothetical protein n=1 Tax=Clostridium sporogenes TaxID=1509 RepID=UPI000A554860|nr:hypothetical protein [Clostridium sporogenes]MBA4509555.1 hypothetical protein [Clostridium sporogenes]UJA30657.1 hypothetical protein L0894_11040 [Clostridium sporogenes]
MYLNGLYESSGSTKLENNSTMVSDRNTNISDIQDIFADNIGEYCYLETFYSGNMFIII